MIITFWLGNGREVHDGCNEEKIESNAWKNILVLTSIVYLISSIHSLWMHETYFSFIQLFAWIGSTLYHANNEMRFFNLDNIFAMAILVTITWCAILSLKLDIIYFSIFVGMLPIALALFVGCGMPASIDICPCCRVNRRTRRTIYVNLHSYWHLVSVIGPILATSFFSKYCPNEIMCSGYFDKYKIVPVIPAVSLMIGIVVNIIGNCLGVMPVL